MKTVRFILLCASALLVIAYLAWSICFFDRQENEETCTAVSICISDSTERQFVSAQEIMQLLNRNGLNPLGRNIQKTSMGEIEETLARHAMISNVECYKTPSHKINIELTQREPKFRVITGTENYYVDTEREIMPTSTEYAAYVPIVSGNRISRKLACGELYDFVSFIENDDFWNAQIEQIYIRDDTKIELVPRIGGHIILLGKLDGYERKLDKLYKLYTEGFSKIGWKAYKVIDLQYKNQIVCKK